MSFRPNDPLFHNQWYLKAQPQGGGANTISSLNVLPAWQQGITGEGVVIGIVDDGVDYYHPDLSPNYRADLGIDLVDGDIQPLAETSNGDLHGTSVAGIAAGRGGNGEGITGVAPTASFTAIRLTAAYVGDAEEAEAMNHQSQAIAIYNNSWGPADGLGLTAPGPLFLAALTQGVQQGRNGLGSLYVWAAGNGRREGDNVNYDGYANSRYVIAVAALDRRGKQTAYSEPGAALLVSAYGDDELYHGITTTDGRQAGGYNFNGLGTFGENYRNLNYTNDFGGTSAAAPMVSGVLALMLQANPLLSWRDAQHILVRTAQRNDPSNPEWDVNGAGRWVNHRYGFGAVNAAAAVDLARNWQPVTAEQQTATPLLQMRTRIPNHPTGARSTVLVEDNLKVERVEVLFNTNHRRNADLRVVLTSPDGTNSVLAETNAMGQFGTYRNWVFSSTRHWDEWSAGNWTLTVSDGRTGKNGVWTNWQLRIYGTGQEQSDTTIRRWRGTNRRDTLTSTRDRSVLRGLGGHDRLLGNSGSDQLWGDAGNDLLLGNGGGDRLLGNTGNDTLLGGSGHDKLRGQQGNDFLHGGAGRDHLWGGTGADTFMLDTRSDQGIDRIHDFQVGLDRVELGHGMNSHGLGWKQRDQHTLLTGNGNPLAWLMGIQAAQLSHRILLGT